MKISTLTLDHVEETVALAMSLGIEDVIIERGMIRAMDGLQSVVLIQTRDLPDFEFESLGLSRLRLFVSRLAMTKGCDGFAAEAIVNGDAVTQLKFKAPSVKVEYRTCNVSQLRAPKAVRDEMANLITYDDSNIEVLSKAVRAMGQNKDSAVTLVKSNEGIFFEIADENNDTLSLELTQCEQLTVAAPAFFAHRYPLLTLINLLKRGDGVIMIGGNKGILNIPIGKFDAYLLPVQ